MHEARCKRGAPGAGCCGAGAGCCAGTHEGRWRRAVGGRTCVIRTEVLERASTAFPGCTLLRTDVAGATGSGPRCFALRELTSMLFRGGAFSRPLTPDWVPQVVFGASSSVRSGTAAMDTWRFGGAVASSTSLMVGTSGCVLESLRPSRGPGGDSVAQPRDVPGAMGSSSSTPEIMSLRRPKSWVSLGIAAAVSRLSAQRLEEVRLLSPADGLAPVQPVVGVGGGPAQGDEENALKGDGRGKDAGQASAPPRAGVDGGGDAWRGCMPRSARGGEADPPRRIGENRAGDCKDRGLRVDGDARPGDFSAPACGRSSDLARSSGGVPTGGE